MPKSALHHQQQTPKRLPKSFLCIWATEQQQKPNFIRDILLIKTLRSKFEFITGTHYTGEWNSLNIFGVGRMGNIYGVEYEGNLRDGMFHGEGTLSYPMGQRVEGDWNKGRLITFKFKFADGLEYSVPWKYCVMPDRRYYTCILEGLKPAGRSLLTNKRPARTIPNGCYDTEDGFYDPTTKCVTSASDPKKIIRIPTAAEERWIMNNCRKAWDEPALYRPDLYEHWVTGRKSESFFNQSSFEDTDSSTSSSDDWREPEDRLKVIISNHRRMSTVSSTSW